MAPLISYKARLFLKAFDNNPALDFVHTFSCKVKHTTIHMVLTLAIAYN